ncbi:MAG: 2-hydroxyacid dehydrogenase [Burkholderiaceae bacterium]
MSKLKIALTRDLLTPDGQPSFGDGPLALLNDHPNLEWSYLPDNVSEITPDIAANYDGLYVNTPLVSAASVARDDCRIKIVARHGVGYDSVDVAALNAKGIIVTNTPIAIRRPVAVAALTMIFALAGRLIQKDRLVRSGQWNDRTAHMGLGLTTRRLGIVGAGGIGRELMKVAAPFGWQMLVADPVVDAGTIAELGGDAKHLDVVMREADFVVVCCVLNEQTRHLINAERLALMKPEAFLVNMARGPVVDEAALIQALQNGQIAGAGLDVFEQEPIAPDNPLIAMDQVLLTPHALCWTDECFDQIAREGLSCIADFAAGRTPGSVVKV